MLGTRFVRCVMFGYENYLWHSILLLLLLFLCVCLPSIIIIFANWKISFHLKMARNDERWCIYTHFLFRDWIFFPDFSTAYEIGTTIHQNPPLQHVLLSKSVLIKDELLCKHKHKHNKRRAVEDVDNSGDGDGDGDGGSNFKREKCCWIVYVFVCL